MSHVPPNVRNEPPVSPAKKKTVGQLINRAFQVASSGHLVSFLGLLLVPLVMGYVLIVLPVLAVKRATPFIKVRRSFSLRSLFVLVTVLCVWLGWDMSIIRERQRLWRLVNEKGGYTLTSDPFENISTIRRLLGDRGRHIFAVPAEYFSEDATDHIRQMFPEAEVMRDPLATMGRYGDEDED